MRREAKQSMETALASKTQSQIEESRLIRELEDTKQRSKEEIVSLRETLKALEKQSHDFEVQALRSEGLRTELESLRKTNDRLMHEKEIEGSLSPTLVRDDFFFFLFLLSGRGVPPLPVWSIREY
jgi:chromosome segregation ATPase